MSRYGKGDESELELAELRGLLLADIAAMLEEANAQPALRKLAETWVELDRVLDQVPATQERLIALCGPLDATVLAMLAGAVNATGMDASA
jgi:hypothetical protein